MRSLLLATVLFVSINASASGIRTTEVICTAKIKNGIEKDTVMVIVERNFPEDTRSLTLAVNGATKRSEIVTRKVEIGAWGQQSIEYTGATTTLGLYKSDTDDNYALALDGEGLGVKLDCDKFVQIEK